MGQLLNRQELRHSVDEAVRLVCLRYKGMEMSESVAKTVTEMIILSSEIDCCVIDVVGMARAYQRTVCYLERVVKTISGDSQDTIQSYIENVRAALEKIKLHVEKCVRGMVDAEKLLHELQL